MKKELIVQRDPKSPISEIFRTLRTNIQFMSSSKELKTLVVTSTLPGEGKSWISANLAIIFAQAGKRVILVDADMRKGRLYHLFNVPPKPGLSNYLSGIDAAGKDRNNILDYIRETEIENLFFIPSGNVPPNPAELLVSDRANEMIKQLKKMSDIVIFDGTPSLLVTDAIILSRFVDSTIIVTSCNETKIENLDKVKKGIENVGGKIAGVVLNKVPMTAKRYENSYYYGSKAGRMTAIDSKGKSSIKSLMVDEETNEDTSNNIENKVRSEIKTQVNEEIPMAKAEELLKQINSYLNEEKGK
jgi:capsular exopolysaccharide synthesis family protein